MFNQIEKVRTVKVELQEQINKIFEYCLNTSLLEDNTITNSFFQYQWKGSNSSISIEFDVKMISFDFEKQGITGVYMQKIVNDSDWKCQYDVPPFPFAPKVYGSQSIITFDIFKNTLRYAIQKGILNTELNQKNWGSKIFQFIAKDLYKVIPSLSKFYKATESITGICIPLLNGLTIQAILKENFDSLNVTINAACKLEINEEKIAEFEVALILEVMGVAAENHITFLVRDLNSTIKYEQNPKFAITNKSQADRIVRQSLNRFKNSEVFGSGWPIYTKHDPTFTVEREFICVYGSIDSHQLDHQSVEKEF